MRTALSSVVLVAMFAVSGCGGGGPRLDASSQQKLEDSMKAMRATMTDPQKREFAQDMAAALGQGAMMSGLGGGDKGKTATSASNAYKPLDGLTAEEIHAKAEEARHKGAKAK